MEDKLNIRSYTWLNSNTGLSWSFMMGELLQTLKQQGHNVLYVSTNGIENNPYVNSTDVLESASKLQEFGLSKKAIDIDLTYTIPPNLTHRFLNNSKNRCCIYNYEYLYWPAEWKKYYGLATHWFPSSNFSAEIFIKNGIPAEKVFVIPHGVSDKIFNKDVEPFKLKTKKKFKFLSVTAPHHRKNIDVLLDTYCRTFTAKDDICLVLKTKIYKHSDGIWDEKTNLKGRRVFELCIGDIFEKLYNKYGKNMPEIELVSAHIENISSLYKSCDAHITATGSEGFGLPLIESMVHGLISVGPRYSGHLDFLNDGNSVLYDVNMRKALITEQYWHSDKRNLISTPNVRALQEAMLKVYKNNEQLREKFAPEMKKTLKEFSWDNAAKKIIKATNKELSHYIPGTCKI